MNDILRIFMVRIGYKASIIAIVMALGGFPFAPRQASLVSFVGAGVPAVVLAALAIPGRRPSSGLFKLLARFFLPTTILMAAHGHGVYLAYALPAKTQLPGRAPGRRRRRSSSSLAYPQAQTALTLFSCFAAILLLLLAVPPSKWFGGGAVVRGDWRILGVVVLLLGWMVAVLAIPLGRTLFELTALPVWQYVALFALAVVWSLCAGWSGAAASSTAGWAPPKTRATSAGSRRSG